MISISTHKDWHKAHPGAKIGLLEISSVNNSRASPKLNERKRATEERLRSFYEGFTRQDFQSLPVMQDYVRYYRQFNKTYHLLLQVESIVLKGKNLPDVSPLVDLNFIAELETFVLTAGHDAAMLQGSITIDVSRDGEQFTQMSGTRRAIRPGDMVMRDEEGICCTIIYGQDNRSPISFNSSHVLYVAYAPAGVPPSIVETHLNRIEENIRLFSPSAIVEQNQLLLA